MTVSLVLPGCFPFSPPPNPFFKKKKLLLCKTSLKSRNCCLPFPFTPNQKKSTEKKRKKGNLSVPCQNHAAKKSLSCLLLSRISLSLCSQSCCFWQWQLFLYKIKSRESPCFRWYLSFFFPIYLVHRLLFRGHCSCYNDAIQTLQVCWLTQIRWGKKER